MPIDIAAVKAKFPLVDVISKYVGAPRWEGGRPWWCCPFHGEKTPSFSVKPDGQHFICFGCHESGDVLDLVCGLEDCTLSGAVEILTGERFSDLPERAASPKIQGDEETPEEKIAKAREIWESTRPIAGTIAERYLRNRGITIDLPECLRFHPDQFHYLSRRRFPAMVAPIILPDDTFKGVHRTFLDPHGDGKAKVEKPKLTRGDLRGGSIPLYPFDLKGDVTEGIESALSVAQATGLPAWPAGSSSLMQTMELPFVVSEVTIWAEGDKSGRKAGAIARDRWLEERRRVSIVWLKPGADPNDLLTKGAAHEA